MDQVLAAGAVALASRASLKHGATAVGIGVASRNHGFHPSAARDIVGSQIGLAPSQTVPSAALEAAEKKRWVDLQMWFACSLSALEMCARCVTWKSATGAGGGGYIAGLAYVRLFSLVLRLLCPVSGTGLDGSSDPVSTLLGADDVCVGVGKTEGALVEPVVTGGKPYDQGSGAEQGLHGDDESLGPRLGWARERLAHIVDDVMWRLREGLPERDIRLRLLQV